MFPLASTDARLIDKDLLSLAQQIEERSPGLEVLAARQFRYPVQQQQLSIQAEQYRKMNLLEKFLLRAAAEVFPAPSVKDLADALGIDPIFIDTTLKDLKDLQRITPTREGLQITPEGSKSLFSEKLPEQVSETWYLIQDLVLDSATFTRQPLDESNEALEDLSPYVKKDLTAFPAFEFHLAELQTRLRESGLELHNPDEDRVVTKIVPAMPPERRWKTIAIFVLYDTLSESPDTAITFQARTEENHSLPMVAGWLESQLQEQHLSLKTLCGLTDDVATQAEEVQEEDSTVEIFVEEHREELRKQAASQTRLKVSGQTLEEQGGTAVQLRDVEIRPAFLTALQEAQEQIIIYSPWVNEQVMDEDFLALLEQLVQRGVRILIGYGIERNEGREERPIPATLQHRLRTIRTAEGTPGVIAEWLGNSHAKEIVIDRKVHFSGSQNWLSYRGDRFPRGETVYKVTIAAEVEKAYNHLAHRFMERVQILWSRATDEERSVALCILGYLGQEQEAVLWIQRESCYHFIPLWLALAQQAIAARQESRILAPLRMVIKLCTAALESQAPLPPEVGPALQRVFNMMALNNQEHTTTFLRDTFPELKLLGLDQQ